MKRIDPHAAFGFWPIQNIPYKKLEQLDQALAEAKVDEGWVSAVESILFPEPDAFDLPLQKQLLEFPRLRFAKTVNPLLANWEKSLLQSMEAGEVAAIKLFPTYHDYTFELPDLAKVAARAREFQKPLLIQIRVNDERNQPRVLQVPAVEGSTLAEFSKQHSDLTMVALAAYTRELEELALGSDQLLADISFVDGADPIGKALDRLPANRLVFGSGAPFLYPKAAELKMKLTRASEQDLQRIRFENLASFRGETDAASAAD